MGIVSDIVSALESQIEATVQYTKAKYKWEFEKNNKPNSKDIYAVRIGSANTISGTTKTITQQRSFEVLLSTRFESKGDNDDHLNSKILELIDNHEALQVVLFRRNLNLARVLVVEAIDITEPDIDNENNIVTMTATYAINFRLEV